MKTNIYLNKNHLGIILIIMFWFVGLNSLKAQYWFPFMKSNGASNQMYGYDNLNTHNLGIGINNIVPLAKFHILEPISTTLPLFRVQVPGVGSIMNWYDTLGTHYGFYETSISGQSRPVMNYFQDPVKIGNVTIGNFGTNASKIYTGTPIDSLMFIMDPLIPTGDALFPLTVYPTRIRVRGNLVTDNFQLLTGARSNYILASDATGNGSWTDISSWHDDDWLPIGDDPKNLYLNSIYTNVGIGTIKPTDKFQVNDGATKFVIGDASEESFGWGTSYLGFNAYKNRGNWTIESNSSNIEEGNNGGSVFYGDILGNMHFITVPTEEPPTGGQHFTDAQMVGMTRMTVSKEGNVGIGTRNPGVALDVQQRSETKIRSFSSGPHTSSLWAMNSNGGYGLSIDENGIGHIDENFWADPAHHIFTFKHSGRVGIGEVVDLDSYSGNSLLFVTGGITTEEVTVKVKENWVDFVFNKDYKLRSLSDLEKYIETNKHLPDIPASSEVEKNGIELGKMNSLLLQKIEELTLYVIELKKEVNELKEKSVVK